MQLDVDLIDLDVENEDHLKLMYSVRGHSQIVPFLRGAPPRDFSTHVFYLRNLASEKKFFLIQTKDGLCGYCQITHASVHLEIGMALHPDFWNQGIGSKALSQLLGWLTQDGRSTEKAVVLYVKKDNVRAMGLYSKHGFKRVGFENEYGEYLMLLKPCPITETQSSIEISN